MPCPDYRNAQLNAVFCQLSIIKFLSVELYVTGKHTAAAAITTPVIRTDGNRPDPVTN